jgi:error-prone DNA polymerase
MTPLADGYAALWCKSNFSFLEGASHPEELVEQAAELGLSALALTDRDGVPGAVRAHVRARELGLKLVVGSEVTLEDDTTIVLLAEDRRGYANLCRLISGGRLRSPKGGCHVLWSEVLSHAPGLIALWGGERSLLAAGSDAVVAERAVALREAFGERLFAMLCRHLEAEEVERERRVARHARLHALPEVAAIEVLYHVPARRRLQDVLTCIRHGVSLPRAGRLIRPNDEHALKAPYAFGRLYSDAPDAVARTVSIAERCTFRLDEIEYRYPSERLPEGLTSTEWLRQLAFEGARERYGDAVPRSVAEQLERELGLIDELDYPGYFLTMWEIVRFCREREILCQGRGSAANSAVCYCLGITAVDPVRMGLLFERFLSRERAEPPDIDLDIEHERREEVIQHVYERYGRSHAAMVANVIRYRPRSAVREVGKALGMPATALDRLAKLLPYHGDVTPEPLKQAGIDPEEPLSEHLIALSNEVLDFPRHLSIHPGGFLLGHEPVSQLVPIENAAMEGRTVIQWDKDDVEALGLFKVDLLGLGALTQLDLAFGMLREHRGLDLSMETIPPDDPETFAQIQRADTVGVFQIESRAQMSMLPRLKPERFYDLVIEVSIVRPGPISGGMVHPYLARRRGEEPVEYPHPSLVPVLEKTLGVPLFQEQVIRVAMVAADYSPGEADQLRRDMAAWRRTGRIERHRERLVARMQAKGIEREFAERVFEQIRGFGEYGFPESHAASFALISYATSYLKRHFQAEFSCALLNAQPMGFYAPSTIIEDAKRHGVTVRPVDVQTSTWDCTLEEDEDPPPLDAKAWRERPLAIRVGLRYVKGLARRDADAVVAARESDGVFRSPEDLSRRAGLGAPAMATLAEAGALDALQPDRRAAFWDAPQAAQRVWEGLPLEQAAEPAALTALEPFEVIDWDYRTTAHSPRGHPMEAFRSELAAKGFPDARELAAMRHGRRVSYVGAIICRQRPGTAGGVTFLTLEDETGFVNVVIWKDVWKRYGLTVKTNPVIGLTGQLEARQGVSHLIVEHAWVPALSRRTATARSRNFH